MLLLLGLAFVVVLVALAVGAVSLVHARSESLAAQDDLVRAKAAISAQDFATAREATSSARANVAKAEDHANGFGSDLWHTVPVASGAVSDMRYLVDALSQSVSVAEIGVDIYPKTMGPHSKLIRGEKIDLPTLKTITDAALQIGPHLETATSDLAQVKGDSPVVGRSIVSARTRAETQIGPLTQSYERYHRLFGRLPNLFGDSGPRHYLLAILNPAELRYSGGASLQVSTMQTDNGALSFGGSYSVADLDQTHPFLQWPPVTGNPFHHPGPQRFTAATFSPYWSVSGEELLRAWHAQTGQKLDGVIGLDLPALADLFRITGPVQVAGYGELNASNLVHTLAGSYDTYQDSTQRHLLNDAIVPAFRSRLLSGGKFLQKGQSLGKSGAARHFVTYFRSARTEKAFAAAGLSGDLAHTPNDYLGVFTQNLNGSKADYWQHRTVTSQVQLKADGSAQEHLSVAVSNPAPAYTQPVVDLHRGYFTRWLGTSIGVFLPRGSQLQSSELNGQPLDLHLHHPRTVGTYHRPFVDAGVTIPPDATATLQARYLVSDAATKDADGNLLYSLSADPQGLVVPQTNTVTLTIPSGFHFGTLVAGWTKKDAHTAVLTPAALTASTTWEIPVEKD